MAATPGGVPLAPTPGGARVSPGGVPLAPTPGGVIPSRRRQDWLQVIAVALGLLLRNSMAKDRGAVRLWPVDWPGLCPTRGLPSTC